MVGEGKKRGRGAVSYVEEFSRVIAVEKDDAGLWACVAPEDEAEGRVERGEGVPGKGRALGGDRYVLRTGDVLPWWVGGIEGRGEG